MTDEGQFCLELILSWIMARRLRNVVTESSRQFARYVNHDQNFGNWTNQTASPNQRDREHAKGDSYAVQNCSAQESGAGRGQQRIGTTKQKEHLPNESKPNRSNQFGHCHIIEATTRSHINNQQAIQSIKLIQDEGFTPHPGSRFNNIVESLCFQSGFAIQEFKYSARTMPNTT